MRSKGLDPAKPNDSWVVARINKDELLRWALPSGSPEEPRNPNRLGVQTSDRVRVTEIDAQVSKVEGKQRELETRVHERELLEVRADAVLKGARLLLDAAKGRELLLEGEWSQTANGLEGIGPGAVTTLRETPDGQAAFDLVLDDGPGAEITLLRSGQQVVAHWIVPAALNPGTARHVVVTYDLGKNAGIETCTIDDAIRLDTQKGSCDRAGIKIGLLGRTKGTIKNLRLVELSARPSP